MAEQFWTDDPITAGLNRIRKKVIHFTELQDAINAWEAAYSIAETTWTDSPSTGVKITSTVITEMQDALQDLWDLVEPLEFDLSHSEINTTIPIIPQHINELRVQMNMFQSDYCYLCDSCDTESCGCDSTCDSDGCDLCDSSCYGQSGCTCHNLCYGQGCGKDSCSCNFSCFGQPTACSCNPGCYSDACDQCDDSCYEESCNQCNVSNYRYPWT